MYFYTLLVLCIGVSIYLVLDSLELRERVRKLENTSLRLANLTETHSGYIEEMAWEIHLNKLENENGEIK